MQHNHKDKDWKLTKREINNARGTIARYLGATIRRLGETATGAKPDGSPYRNKPMSKEAIAAAKILLDKTMPTMQHLEHEEAIPDRTPQEVYSDLANALMSDTRLQDQLGVIPKHLIALPYTEEKATPVDAAPSLPKEHNKSDQGRPNQDPE